MQTKNRDDRIRTCGPFVPNEVRYQTAPHPGDCNLKRSQWSEIQADLSSD